MAETVLELVIRTRSAADAEWLLAEIKNLVATYLSARLDVYGVFPASVYDAEPEAEGVPA